MGRRSTMAEFRERFENAVLRPYRGRRRIPLAKEQAIRALIGGGVSQREAAQMIGVSRGTVVAAIRRAEAETVLQRVGGGSEMSADGGNGAEGL